VDLFPRRLSPWLRIIAFLLGISIVLAFGVQYMINMPGKSYSGPLPPLKEEENEIQTFLLKHIQILAGEIGERNLWQYQALQSSANYIERIFKSMGYEVFSQEYGVQGKKVKNIEVQLEGTHRPNEIVLIGAHYDSVRVSPGANDNATGTAAVLEIARLLFGQPNKRTVRFVAFVNEEPPFSMTQDMGSRVYANRSRELEENIVAMFSIETIGYYDDAEGSQQYPFPFRYFYPSTANFIAFVGNVASKSLVYDSIDSFRRHTSFPSEGVAAPGWMTGIGWSDHQSFWREGYPALMVTDTALFRYAQYHSQEDTPDKVNYPRTARVVAGLARVVSEVANPPKKP